MVLSIPQPSNSADLATLVAPAICGHWPSVDLADLVTIAACPRSVCTVPAASQPSASANCTVHVTPWFSAFDQCDNSSPAAASLSRSHAPGCISTFGFGRYHSSGGVHPCGAHAHEVSQTPALADLTVLLALAASQRPVYNAPATS